MNHPPASGSPIVHDRDRYRRDVRDLRRTLEDVSADLGIAMFRAYQHGVSYEDIAHAALRDVPEVERAITMLSREDDVEEWEDPGTWVKLYPHI